MLVCDARLEGIKKTTLELNDEAAAEYERLNDSITPAEEERLLNQLGEKRELKQKGVRATNRSANQDAMQNAVRLGDIVRRMRFAEISC